MRSRFIAVAACAALLTSSVALADATHRVRGDVSSFDATSRELVVKQTMAPRKEVKLTLADGAWITAQGKRGTPADLRAGERVRITYIDKGTQHEAKRVEILADKAPPSKKG
jgi:hypothetical protein